MVPPLKNFRKLPILVSLLNLPELGFAGSFGGAKCSPFAPKCSSVFQAAEFGLLFEPFSLGLPFEEFQKMADFGVFAKFARTRLCGQLRRRSLRQNVLR